MFPPPPLKIIGKIAHKKIGEGGGGGAAPTLCHVCHRLNLCVSNFLFISACLDTYPSVSVATEQQGQSINVITKLRNTARCGFAGTGLDICDGTEKSCKKHQLVVVVQKDIDVQEHREKLTMAKENIDNRC